MTEKKAFLLLPHMPQGCVDCPFCIDTGRYEEDTGAICAITRDCVFSTDDERDEDCPLKELPNKRWLLPELTTYNCGFQDGYNAALDLLVGMTIEPPNGCGECPEKICDEKNNIHCQLTGNKGYKTKYPVWCPMHR